MAQSSKNTTSNVSRKFTLGSVFKARGLELLTYIDKNMLVTNDVVFCVIKAEKEEVSNSKFNIAEQWKLTILIPVSDGTVRKYWLTFTPNEVRDDYMQALQEGLKEAQLQDMQAVHSCKLQAIPTSQYDNPFFALNFTNEDCHCGVDE